MLKACPITLKQVDESVVRMHAAVISIFGISFMLYADIVWLIILLYDFSVRIAGYPKLSPVFLLSRSLVNILSLKSHKVDAGPKEFAAKIGLIFIVAALAAYLLGYIYTSIYIILMLAVCAGLEAVFAFCVGCEIYPFWRAVLDKKDHR